MTTVPEQLADELHAAADRLAPIVGPEAGLTLSAAIESRLPLLAHQLTADGDDGARADTAVDVLTALHGDHDPPADWWLTPLGRACAMSLGSEHAQSWTHAIAASWLGVTRGTVAQLVSRGTIARHPDGGVVPADVIRYGMERRR